MRPHISLVANPAQGSWDGVAGTYTALCWGERPSSAAPFTELDKIALAAKGGLSWGHWSWSQSGSSFEKGIGKLGNHGTVPVQDCVWTTRRTSFQWVAFASPNQLLRLRTMTLIPSSCPPAQARSRPPMPAATKFASPVACPASLSTGSRSFCLQRTQQH